MLHSALIVLGCVSASFEELVERFSGSVSGAFTSVDDFSDILKLVLAENRQVSAHATGDLVDMLRADLGADDRLAAVSHFFDRNQSTLREVVADMLCATNDVAIGLMKIDPVRFPDCEVFKPLRTSLATYIERRRSVFLYDSLPWKALNGEVALFGPVRPSGWTSTPGCEIVQGFIPETSPLFGLLGRQGTTIWSFDGQLLTVANERVTQVIDTSTGLSAKVEPEYSWSTRFLPRARVVAHTHVRRCQFAMVADTATSMGQKDFDKTELIAVESSFEGVQGIAFVTFGPWQILRDVTSIHKIFEALPAVQEKQTDRLPLFSEIVAAIEAGTVTETERAWRMMVQLQWVNFVDGEWESPIVDRAYSYF